MSITVLYSTFINPGTAGPFAYVIPADKPLVKPSMCPTKFIEEEKELFVTPNSKVSKDL